ncbi:MAG: hypothetical protein LQ345_001299 [Seirophora villosa]|nr:MAG: hypothetical protein LQ345_001299 [Seirophora villosa]
MSSSDGRGRGAYRCTVPKTHSRLCTAAFSRASDLERHQQRFHPRRGGTTFVHCNPSTGERRRSTFQTQTVAPLGRQESWRTESHSSPPSERSTAPSPPPGQSPAGRSDHPRAPTPPPPDPLRDSDEVPAYEVKLSRRDPLQQRGVEWLTRPAKLHFHTADSTILERWGLTSGHRGTCLLIAEGWRFLPPLELVDLLSTKTDLSLILDQAPRAWYSYGDHATTHARGKAWFSTWPRSGLELDNFLGCGPYKPMDASHLCHQGLCIVHVVYETAEVNQDRARCQTRARFLRGEGRPIPERCTEHTPPCLMQHAALTALEACRIQAAVYCLAKNLPPLERCPRPRRYLYPTFESTLPSTFSAVSVDRQALASETDDGLRGRPNLCCTFCPPERIRGYASVVALWSHVVHHHQEVDSQRRVGEICRTGTLWREYWESLGGGRKSNETASKLEQISQGLTWTDVLNWKLRA